MSKEDFTLSATSRKDVGKGASRRLRRLEGLTPAIIYGDEKAPQSICVEHKEIVKHLENEAFYSHIISLEVDGKAESVILKDLQRHPAKAQIMHADFLRVSQSKKINVNVPLHFINEDKCPGVRLGGAKISHTLTQVEISCLPKDLPEFIEVDFGEVEAGQVIHISDLKLPKGVESVALSHGGDHDLTVASVNKPKGNTEDDETAAEGESEGESEE